MPLLCVKDGPHVGERIPALSERIAVFKERITRQWKLG